MLDTLSTMAYTTSMRAQTNQIAYTPQPLADWALNMPAISALTDFRPLPRPFYDIWRILHIDGFGRKQFFLYSPEKDT
jgi:hypothetical protein